MVGALLIKKLNLRQVYFSQIETFVVIFNNEKLLPTQMKHVNEAYALMHRHQLWAVID